MSRYFRRRRRRLWKAKKSRPCGRSHCLLGPVVVMVRATEPNQTKPPSQPTSHKDKKQLGCCVRCHFSPEASPSCVCVRRAKK